MSTRLTRRAVLIGGAAAVGTLALHRAGAAAGGADPPHRGERAPALPVALRRCASYEPALVHHELSAALAATGDPGALVRGRTVTVKLNLTGGGEPCCGLAAARTYQVHPTVVAALCAVLARAGARRIVLAEGMYFRERPEERLARQGWDIGAILSAGEHRVTFENTRNRGPWPAYARLAVSFGGLVFPAFDVNARYRETDVFVSLAKLKRHRAAGITGAVKNLLGVTPMSLYGNDAPNEDSIENRSELLHHGRKQVPAGVPPEIGGGAAGGRDAAAVRSSRVVVDCLGARPVGLAVIDGIETLTGGEGPWAAGLRSASPGLLLAGRNAVCTDAIAAAVMGIDPDAGPMQPPFAGENHLRLAAEAGLGSNHPARIEVLGLALQTGRALYGRFEPHGEPTGVIGDRAGAAVAVG